ncbi:MAG TPA: hypothetical protein V6D20_07460, partial [Candidatus Obscuribacterales bacterium]
MKLSQALPKLGHKASNSCTLSPGKLHKVRGFVRNSASVIFMGLPWSMLLILILSAQFPIKS